MSIIRIAAIGFLSASLALAQDPAATSAPPAAAVAPAVHPVAADVDRMLGELAGHGIRIGDDADRASLYECIARTVDPSARVYEGDAFALQARRNAGEGLHPGFTLTMSNGAPVVASVPDGYPADLRAGDRLLAIGAQPVTNLSYDTILATLRERETTNLTLLIQRNGLATSTVSVALAPGRIPVLELVELFPRAIGYARVNGWFPGAATSLAAVVRAWAAEERAGAILDLRGAGGDDVEGVASLAGLFASPGSLLFSFRDRDGNELASHRAPADAAPLAIPLIVLVDARTAGAAELFAAVASDSLLGSLVVGRATAGDPSIREGLPLPGGHVLYIATRHAVTGNGLLLDGTEGLAPNLPVSARPGRTEYEPDGAGDRRQRLEEEALDRALRDRIRGDDDLQRAVDVVLGLKALNIRPKAGH